MRGDVMDAVVLAGEDDVAVLQEHNPARQAEVRVRPLVNLVGEGHEDGQCKQVAVPGVVMVNFRCEREAETGWDRTLLSFFLFSWISYFQVMASKNDTAVSCRSKCQAEFVDAKLTGGEGEEVEGHVC